MEEESTTGSDFGWLRCWAVLCRGAGERDRDPYLDDSRLSAPLRRHVFAAARQAVPTRPPPPPPSCHNRSIRADERAWRDTRPAEQRSSPQPHYLFSYVLYCYCAYYCRYTIIYLSYGYAISPRVTHERGAKIPERGQRYEPFVYPCAEPYLNSVPPDGRTPGGIFSFFFFYNYYTYRFIEQRDSIKI